MNIVTKTNNTNNISSNKSDGHYILLTPGPLSTTLSVKSAMLKDWCTWDDDYNHLVQDLRAKLINLSLADSNLYSSVLMQGSGTFSVESVIGSAIPENGKILVITNGAYGDRIIKIAETLKISVVISRSNELSQPDMNDVREKLKDKTITHAALVHVETTTGIQNPLSEIAELVKSYEKIFIVDAMSSFGGIPIDIEKLNIDFLISSANKCIEGVPGFGFIIAKKERIESCKGRARSHSLDLYDQWDSLEHQNGKWRFTSPTHVVRAFYQALIELENEGGIVQRHLRYKENQQTLSEGMKKLGFKSLISEEYQSPIITTFYSPDNEKYNFKKFYNSLKDKGFVIYPGKVTELDTFRIGNIGSIYPDDIRHLLKAIEESIFW